MEPVIFWTMLSAILGCKTYYLTSAPIIWLKISNGDVNKFSNMKESQEWFTIKLDDKAYPVFRIVQPDESVIFIAQI